jgi:hypothetical protein
MGDADRDFWDTFRETWPDMSLVNGLIHAGAADTVIHEAMCAAREGRVPDIEPERIHKSPRQQSRWVISGMSISGGLLSRRVEEPDEDEPYESW